jgi:hypothetical protein
MYPPCLEEVGRLKTPRPQSHRLLPVGWIPPDSHRVVGSGRLGLIARLGLAAGDDRGDATDPIGEQIGHAFEPPHLAVHAQLDQTKTPLGAPFEGLDAQASGQGSIGVLALCYGLLVSESPPMDPLFSRAYERASPQDESVF